MSSDADESPEGHDAARMSASVFEPDVSAETTAWYEWNDVRLSTLAVALRDGSVLI
jgi:hypothetical protein